MSIKDTALTIKSKKCIQKQNKNRCKKRIKIRRMEKPRNELTISKKDC